MRSVRPPLVVMLLAWLLVVTAVGVVTYLVVGSAGRGVGQASAAATVAPLPPAGPDPTASPGPTTPASAVPRPTRSATPAPTVSRTTAPAPAPTRSSPPVVRTAPPPAPTTVTRSFTTQGGTVVATCTGSTVRRDSITPRDGWRVEDDTEHGTLEVKFKAAEAEVELTLRCVGGVPTRVDG
ncbi:MAG TPA: hypothetical protein VFL46_03670 [Phycicoccus sp.]|nr:hypothetical protein [Phycicoccus sp.]